jgi:hypothetical protein
MEAIYSSETLVPSYHTTRHYTIEDIVIILECNYRRPRDTLYLQKLALTSPTRGGRSVGTVRLRTKATESFLDY